MSCWTQIYAAIVNSVDPNQLASKKPTDLHLLCLPFSLTEFISTILIKWSDWLTIWKGYGILIYSAGQGLITMVWRRPPCFQEGAETIWKKVYPFSFFFFLIWVLRPFQEYFTYIEPIAHQRWAKTGEPGEKPPDHP